MSHASNSHVLKDTKFMYKSENSRAVDAFIYAGYQAPQRHILNYEYLTLARIKLMKVGTGKKI